MENSTKSSTNLQDLTFIGTGIATAYTLLPLLQRLNSEYKNESYRITLIEKNQEIFTGIAYGERSGDSALLITSLVDFLPDEYERQQFVKWLDVNKSKLIYKLLSDGNTLSKKWLATHKIEIEQNKWDDIYIPRRFFGIYIKDRLKKEITKSETINPKLKITYVTAKASNIIRNKDNTYSVLIDGKKENVISQLVVLSVGIPPVRHLWPQSISKHIGRDGVLIDNPYSKGLNFNLDRIKDYITDKTKNINILIIGSNASAMEMIYKTMDTQKIAESVNKILVISPQGVLPNSAKNEKTKEVIFKPNNLLKLQIKMTLSAKEIYKASQKDLDYAEKKGYSAAITEVPISEGFKALLSKLNETELRNFACFYGNEIGKRQRRAGKHYTDVVDNLRAKGKLENIQGYFNALNLDNDSRQIKFSYLNKGQANIMHEESIDVVINCTGGKTLDNSTISKLLDNLIESKLCIPNPSMRGFRVNDNLEASPNLFVAGPLLAGNLVNGMALWHIEHCGRIIYLGKELAKRLL